MTNYDFSVDALPPSFLSMNICWKALRSSSGAYQGRCTQTVDPKCDLGLCQTHIDELMDTNDEV